MRNGAGAWIWNSSTGRFPNMKPSRAMLQRFTVKPGMNSTTSPSLSVQQSDKWLRVDCLSGIEIKEW